MGMLIQPFDPSWKSDFESIEKVLLDRMYDSRLKIEHIGSTSVAGMAAKPIIDLTIIHSDPSRFNQISKDLTGLGYKHVGDQGIPGREVFKRDPGKHIVLDSIHHHLYVCHSQNGELKRHLLFRDYLRISEKDREVYKKLKLEIAKEANQDKKRYAILKEEKASDFIEGILAKAFKMNS